MVIKILTIYLAEWTCGKILPFKWHVSIYQINAYFLETKNNELWGHFYNSLCILIQHMGKPCLQSTLKDAVY